MTFDSLAEEYSENIDESVGLCDWLERGPFVYSAFVVGSAVRVVRRRRIAPTESVEWELSLSGSVEDVKISLDAADNLFVIVLDYHDGRYRVGVWEHSAAGFRFHGYALQSAYPLRLQACFFDVRGNFRIEYLAFDSYCWRLGVATKEAGADWVLASFRTKNLLCYGSLRPDRIGGQINTPIAGNLFMILEDRHGREPVAVGNLQESSYTTVGDGASGLLSKVPGWEDWFFLSHNEYTQRVKKDLTDYSALHWTGGEYVHGITWRKGKIWTVDYNSAGYNADAVVAIEIDPDDWSYTKHDVFGGSYGEHVDPLWITSVGEDLYISGYGKGWLCKWNPDTGDKVKIKYPEVKAWYEEFWPNAGWKFENFLTPIQTYERAGVLRCLTHTWAYHASLSWNLLIDFEHDDPTNYRVLRLDGVEPAGHDTEFFFVSYPYVYLTTGRVLFRVDLVRWCVDRSVYIGDLYGSGDYHFPEIRTDGHYLYLTCPGSHKIAVFTFDLRRVAIVSAIDNPYHMLIEEPYIYFEVPQSPSKFWKGRVGWTNKPTPKIGLLKDTRLPLGSTLEESSSVSDFSLSPALTKNLYIADYKEFGPVVSQDQHYIYAVRDSQSEPYIYQFDKVTGSAKLISLPTSEVIGPPRDIISDGKYVYAVADHATSPTNRVVVHRFGVEDFSIASKETLVRQWSDASEIHLTSLAKAGGFLYVVGYDGSPSGRHPILLFAIRCDYKSGNEGVPQVESVPEGYKFHLKYGQQFISLPVYPSVTSPEGLFGADVEVWQYDPDIGWSRPSRLEPGRGYLVRCPSDRTITVTGSPYTVDWTSLEGSLKTGWNLVGIGEAAVEIGNYYHDIQAWDFERSQYFHKRKGEKLKVGHGYWIRKDGNFRRIQLDQTMWNFRPFIVAHGDCLYIAGTEWLYHYLIKIPVSEFGKEVPTVSAVRFSTEKYSSIRSKPIVTDDYIFLHTLTALVRLNAETLSKEAEVGFGYPELLDSLTYDPVSDRVIAKYRDANVLYITNRNLAGAKLGLVGIKAGSSGPIYYDADWSRVLYFLHRNPSVDYGHLYQFQILPIRELEFHPDRVVTRFSDGLPVPWRVLLDSCSVGLSRSLEVGKVIVFSVICAVNKTCSVFKSLAAAFVSNIQLLAYDWLGLVDSVSVSVGVLRLAIVKSLSLVCQVLESATFRVRHGLSELVSLTATFLAYDWRGLVESVSVSLDLTGKYIRALRSAFLSVVITVRRRFLKGLLWTTQECKPTYPKIEEITGGFRYTFRQGSNWFTPLTEGCSPEDFGADVEVWAWDPATGWYHPDSFDCSRRGYLMRCPTVRTVEVTGTKCAAFSWEDLKNSLTKGTWNLVGVYSDITVGDADNLILGYDEAEGKWCPIVQGSILERGRAYWILEGTPGEKPFEISIRFNAWDWLGLKENVPPIIKLSKNFRTGFAESIAVGIIRRVYIATTMVAETLKLTLGRAFSAVCSLADACQFGILRWISTLKSCCSSLYTETILRKLPELARSDSVWVSITRTSAYLRKVVHAEVVRLSDVLSYVPIKRPVEALSVSVNRVFEIVFRLFSELPCRLRWRLRIYNLLAGIRVSSRFRKLNRK